MANANSATRDDHNHVFEVIMASLGSQVVRTLALMSVAEHLHGTALTADQIAERESCDPASTYRLLRAGAALGFLHYQGDTNQFVGTPRLDILREDSPLSLKYYAQSAPGPAFWLPNLLMPEAVRDGGSHVIDALGSSVFEYFAEHEDQARMFSAAMANFSTPVIREAVTAIDPGTAQLVVDVGGANGTFVAELLHRNPKLKGAVLDLPTVIPGVDEAANAQGLQGRMTGIAGDFFQEVPAADIYLLKSVLHDWDDEACVKILSNIRTALNPGGRVLIVDMVVTADTSLTTTLMDMAMLAAFTGQEREMSHFETLFDSAGLALSRSVSLHSPFYLMDVCPSAESQIGAE